MATIMASYGLYLVPTPGSLAATLETAPANVQRHVQAVLDTPHWGGLLHVTLADFAGLDGVAPASDRRCHRQHGCDVRQVARVVAETVVRTKAEAFSIPSWHGASRADKGFYFFYVQPNNDSAMDVLLQALQQQHQLYGVKQDVNKCHVTFLLDNSLSYDGVAEFLSQLMWDLAIVQIPDDDELGRTAFIQEKFALTR